MKNSRQLISADPSPPRRDRKRVFQFSHSINRSNSAFTSISDIHTTVKGSHRSCKPTNSQVHKTKRQSEWSCCRRQQQKSSRPYGPMLANPNRILIIHNSLIVVHCATNYWPFTVYTLVPVPMPVLELPQRKLQPIENVKCLYCNI